MINCPCMVKIDWEYDLDPPPPSLLYPPLSGDGGWSGDGGCSGDGVAN